MNLTWGDHFSLLRPETVYAKVRTIKAHLGPACPAGWTPHWFRHTHASALLLGPARLEQVRDREAKLAAAHGEILRLHRLVEGADPRA